MLGYTVSFWASLAYTLGLWGYQNAKVVLWEAWVLLLRRAPPSVSVLSQPLMV